MFIFFKQKAIPQDKIYSITQADNKIEIRYKNGDYLKVDSKIVESITSETIRYSCEKEARTYFDSFLKACACGENCFCFDFSSYEPNF